VIGEFDGLFAFHPHPALSLGGRGIAETIENSPECVRYFDRMNGLHRPIREI